MDSIIPNNQQVLAHDFFINEMMVNKQSHQAILTIKRWNWISKLPAAPSGSIGKRQTKKLLMESCLAVIPNQFLLLEEQHLN